MGQTRFFFTSDLGSHYHLKCEYYSLSPEWLKRLNYNKKYIQRKENINDYWWTH